MPQCLMRLWAEERAQNLPEYALLLLLICLTAVSTVSKMAARVNLICSNASSQMSAANNPSLKGGSLAYGAPPAVNPQSKSKDDRKLKPAH